jgi:hypothetical protein
MDLLELLDKRKHVYKFNDQVPPKDLIEDLLYKAWKVTPSKNNFMPYHVNVLGPDQKELKKEVHALSMFNKKRTNERANVNNIPNFTEEGQNPNFTFYESVPYLLIFSQRVAEPNTYIAEAIVDMNDIYEQMHEDMFGQIQTTTCVEIGIFKANLTAFALEQGLDTTCIKCYPAEIEAWEKFPFLEGPVMLIVGIGYSEKSRKDIMSEEQILKDPKPEPETIIKWI